MSRVLALDTATHTCTLALYDEGELYGRHEIVARAHNRHILGMLSAILDGRALADAVDVIACGVGPGSFTGLRVAVSVAQGLAWSQALPVHAFCSLTAQAYAAAHHGFLRDGDRVGLELDAGRAIGQLRIDNRLPLNTCLIAGGRRILLDVARNSSVLRIFSMQGESVA